MSARRLKVYSALLLVLALALMAWLWSSAPQDAALGWRLARGLVGSAVLAGVFASFGRLDAILGQPLSAEAKLLGLLSVAPAMFADAGGERSACALAALLFALAMHLGWRGGRPLSAGLALGCACGLRCGLLIALPWLLFRRGFRTAGAAILVVAVLAAAALAVGVDGGGAAELSPERTTPWSLAAGAAARSPLALAGGHGLRGLFTAFGGGERATGGPGLPGVLEVVHGAAAVAIVALCLLAAQKREAGRRTTLASTELAAALAASALLSARSVPGDFVLLLPASMLGFDAWRLSATCGLRRAAGLLWCTGAVGAILAAACGLGLFTAAAVGPAASSLQAAALLALVCWPRFHPRGLAPGDLAAGAGCGR